MDLTQYLSASMLLLLIIGCWTLVHAARRAVDGYQDEFGFHFGVMPLTFSFYSNSGASLYGSIGSTLKSATNSTKRPRTAGSKPPMLPEGLSIDDLNPQPATNHKRPHKASSKKKLSSDQTQIPFPDEDSSPSSQ